MNNATKMPAPGEQHRATSITADPFEESEIRVSTYTAEQIATLQARLNKFLGPEYISSRDGPGGKKVHYIAAVQCIQLANEVFGFNGWSSQIREVQVDYVEEVANTGKFNMAASVIMRVTLRDGTFHEDIGYGQIENCKSKAMGFEKAKKEATTDALKRALRNFGNVLGNCIYDKDYVGKVTKMKVKPRKFDIEDLHRHVDYASIKQETVSIPGNIAPVGADIDVPRRSETICPKGKTAAEDEFDTADFDDVDFSVADDGHPDEVILEEPVISTHFGAANGNVNGMQRSNSSNKTPTGQAQQRGPPPRAGAPILNSSINGYNAQSDGRALPQQNPSLPNKPSFAQPHPPHTNISPSRTAQSGSSAPPIRNQPTAANKNLTNFTDISMESIDRPRNSVDSSTNAATLPGASSEAPAVFLSARAATILQNPNPGAITPDAVFNPHAESPSIRKTAGVDHSKSMKLGRDLVPVKADTPATSAQPALTNPGMEGVRRIGMPPNAASPVANRSSYKPPLKRPYDGGGQGPPRPPLNDVTAAANNVLQRTAPDSKRQRMEDTTVAKSISQ